MPRPFIPRIDFSHSPTLWEFVNDDNPVRIAIGPVGSGKTTCACAEVMRRALQQEPSPRDNIRYFKCAIVRNTTPELKRTTIQTWLQLFPEVACGPIRNQSPVQHHITVPPQNGVPGLDLLIDFMALDQPKHVRELLSYEGSMIYFNELREIPKAIIDTATLRTGRYPSLQSRGVDCTWDGVIADTNPPDELHWLHEIDLTERPPGWSFYHQPPAVVEMKPHGGAWVADDRDVDLVVADPAHIFQQAGRLWAVNPAAENLANLPVNRVLDPSLSPVGPGSYYARLGGKSHGWIVCYFQGRYSFVSEGKAVVPEFDPDMMVSDDVPILDDVAIHGGADIGGGTFQPAAIFGQRHPRGVWLIHAECAASDLGLIRFADAMRYAYNDVYGNRECKVLHGDPAGATRDVLFEVAAFDHLRSKGWNAQPAPTNDIKTRIEAWRAPCNRLIDGKPGLLIHRRCKMLITGLSGGWHYRKIEVTGTERYSEIPEKNQYSHPADAGGYLLLGGGEHRMISRGTSERAGGVNQAAIDFDVFTGKPNQGQRQADTSFNPFDA